MAHSILELVEISLEMDFNRPWDRSCKRYDYTYMVNLMLVHLIDVKFGSLLPKNTLYIPFALLSGF